MWKTPTALAVFVLILLAGGCVMLASTSAVKALADYGDANFFIKRQMIWIILALITGGLAAKIDYHRWRYLALPILIISLALLTLVLLPGYGAKIGGSRRWLHFSYFSFQPSEPAKFALVLALAWWLAREQRHITSFARGALVPMLIMGMILGLVFLEPDFGTTFLAALVGLAIMFLAGTRLRYLGAFGLLGLGGFSLALLHNEVRLQRILAFRDPEKYSQTFAYQLNKSIDAFIAGGWTGVGLGKSVQKHFYLPEAHTDFIFAIIGEELGLLATLLVTTLFAGIFFCGLRISWRAHDQFGRLLAFGLTMMISLQALYNIAVVLGCMPTKGLPLPFISFGGSSLITSLLSVGVLINIAQHGGEGFKDADARIVKDRLRKF